MRQLTERPSPSLSATDYPPGTVALGNDLNQWIVATRRQTVQGRVRTVQRWVRLTEKSATASKSKSKRKSSSSTKPKPKRKSTSRKPATRSRTKTRYSLDTRPSPHVHAGPLPVGVKMRGGDGRMYRVAERSNGTHYWRAA